MQMRMARVTMVTLMCAGVLASSTASARPAAPVDQQVKDAQAEIDRLRQELSTLRQQYDARLAALEEKLAQIASAGTAAGAPAQAAPAGFSGSKVFNPDIAVVGNFRQSERHAHAGDRGERGGSRAIPL